MKSERDTHFAGFAKLLMDDLIDAQVEHYHDNNREDFVTTLIAQRAYDLVHHALEYDSAEMVDWPLEQVMKSIPDLTEWPISPDSA